MEITKQQVIAVIRKAFDYDRRNLTHKELCNKYHEVRKLTGVDVWSLNNKGKDMNRYNINSLGGNSGGGRLGAIQRSIYKVKG